MNCLEHPLPELHVERAHLADALSAILHTVVFYRTSGTVKPVDRACTNIPTTYATRGDTGVDEKVQSGVSRFLASLREVTPPQARASLIVSFYYEHSVTNFFFSRREEKVWEIWRFPITLIPPNTAVAHHGPGARVGQGEAFPPAPGLADLEQTDHTCAEAAASRLSALLLEISDVVGQFDTLSPPQYDNGFRVRLRLLLSRTRSHPPLTRGVGRALCGAASDRVRAPGIAPTPSQSGAGAFAIGECGDVIRALLALAVFIRTGFLRGLRRVDEVSVKECWQQEKLLQREHPTEGVALPMCSAPCVASKR